MNTIVDTAVSAAAEAQRAGDVLTTMRVGDIKEGRNPRTYYDPKEQAELEEGIRAAAGVFTPILIRPIQDGHEVVAGYKRRRGAINTLGEDYLIPVLIRQMTDDEADRLATMENTHRSAMSPADEAEAAARELGRCNGDRDETARRMGLKRQVLDKRLALMNCSDGVRRALTERKIQLGHAELLATAPKDKQDKVLEKLLSASSLPAVAEFKAQLETLSKSMASAIFSLDECAQCHHNSGNQKALFAEAIADGHCTNGTCFDQKTEAVLESKKKSLEENYPRVVIVRPGDNSTLVKLKPDGSTGVGKDQYLACKACKCYGAAVSAVPGKMGNVYESQCFDAACNTKKVAARIKAEKEASQPKTNAPAATKPATGKAAEKSTPNQNPAAVVVTSVQDSARVVEYRVELWRKALKRELAADARENLSMLIGIMMTRGGSNVSTTKLASAFEKLTQSRPSNSTNVGEAAALISRAPDDVRAQMLSGIVITITENIEKSVLPDMLTFMQVDLAKHWKLNKEFLELLTKSEIEVIAEELGLKAALGDKYSKVMGGKKDEIVKAMLAVEGFDYAGKVPKVLQYTKAV